MTQGPLQWKTAEAAAAQIQCIVMILPLRQALRFQSFPQKRLAINVTFCGHHELF